MNHYYSVISPRQSDLMHYGVPGMKWGQHKSLGAVASSVYKSLTSGNTRREFNENAVSTAGNKGYKAIKKGMKNLYKQGKSKAQTKEQRQALKSAYKTGTKALKKANNAKHTASEMINGAKAAGKYAAGRQVVAASLRHPKAAAKVYRRSSTARKVAGRTLSKDYGRAKRSIDKARTYAGQATLAYRNMRHM